MTSKSTPSPGYEDRRNRARHRYPMCEGAAKPKRPSIRAMIKKAEKAGAKVTVAPDGTVSLQFGEAQTEQTNNEPNPWERAMQEPKQ
jgi:hypothetical protein